MSFSVKRDFLDDNALSSVSSFLDKSEWWSDFSGDGNTKRKAFSATYKKEDVPKFLEKFLTDKHNLYHFIGIETYNSGAIDEHVDSDFQDYFINNNPGCRVGLPETVVYYVDIDPDMEGGELILNDYIPPVKPCSNMAVVLESGTPHAVKAVVKADKPRLVLVCERYYILSRFFNSIKSPEFRKG